MAVALKQSNRPPRVLRNHLPAYARHIYATTLRCRYRTLKILAFSSSRVASYVISVRRASLLPAASSGFHLTMDTLAVRLTIPPAGFVEDFHLLVIAPCRTHQIKEASDRLTPL
jgi:hypothetical protein